MTALVGTSGSGKTSCLSLLKRLYEPQEGEILLDGRPLHHYRSKYLHQKVGLQQTRSLHPLTTPGGCSCAVVLHEHLMLLKCPCHQERV